MKRVWPVLPTVILNFCTALSSQAQQVTCTPSVPQNVCKQFDGAFGETSMWPPMTFTKNVTIVVVDPAQFKTERAKLDAEIDAAAKNHKTVGDINRASGREAGKGMFTNKILECPKSSMVERIVISTEAITPACSTSNSTNLASNYCSM